LLDKILAAPDDDAPRLVWADWLTERGDPRGELIHVQCALAAGRSDGETRAALLARERALLTEHGRWLLDALGLDGERTAVAGVDDAPSGGARAHFHRGLLDVLEVPIEHWVAAEDALVETPLTALVLTDVDARHAEALATLRGPPTLATLALVRSFLDGGGAGAALAASPMVRGLRSLSLARAAIRDQAGAALVRAAAFDGLEELELTGNRLGAGFADALAAAPWLGDVRTLRLDECHLGDDGVAALARAPGWRSLRTLRLDACSVHAPGAIALASSTALRSLTHLSLAWNGLREKGARALATTRRLPSLVELDVRNCSLSADAIAALRERWGPRLLVG